MIKISTEKNNDIISSILIEGHSGYEEEGKDIVCSSVSSIAITTVNAILRINEKALDYQEKDGYLKINILKHDKYIDILVENMYELLKELEKKYNKYIKIK